MPNLAPRVTRSNPGRLKDARSAMEKDLKKFAKDGYTLTEEGWEPEASTKQPKQSKHKQHGILWKMTDPVGASLGVARATLGAAGAVGSAAISKLSPNDRGTLRASFERPE
jgi:hypothetical protein